MTVSRYRHDSSTAGLATAADVGDQDEKNRLSDRAGASLFFRRPSFLW